MTKPPKTAVAIFVGALVLAGLLFATGFVRDIITGPRQPQVRSSGKALIKSTFSLVDHTGKLVSDKDFRGMYLLVVFGYTSCPDVCPAELQTMSAALDKLGAKAAQIQPLFITVDPKRDTVAKLAEYVSHFHDRLIGLTGTPEQIAVAVKSFRVYFAKAAGHDAHDNYLMDHSSVTYLMDRQGQYVAHFTYGTLVDKMAARLAKLP